MTEWQFWLAMLVGLPVFAVLAMLVYAGACMSLAVYHDKKGTRK